MIFRCISLFTTQPQRHYLQLDLTWLEQRAEHELKEHKLRYGYQNSHTHMRILSKNTIPQ